MYRISIRGLVTYNREGLANELKNASLTFNDTALDGSVNYPIRDCILLAGNPLKRLFSIHMGKPVASRFGQMERKLSA